MKNLRSRCNEEIARQMKKPLARPVDIYFLFRISAVIRLSSNIIKKIIKPTPLGIIHNNEHIIKLTTQSKEINNNFL